MVHTCTVHTSQGISHRGIQILTCTQEYHHPELNMQYLNEKAIGNEGFTCLKVVCTSFDSFDDTKVLEKLVRVLNMFSLDTKGCLHIKQVAALTCSAMLQTWNKKTHLGAP